MGAVNLTFLSLGAGVQSSALLVLSAIENPYGVPRADVAIFADTQDEPRWVYDHLVALEMWAQARGVRIERVTAGRLSDSIYHRASRKRFASIPAFVKINGKKGILRRQCTREYKIEPIVKRVRELLGLRKGQWAKGRVTARCLLGISVDEASRMKANREPWIENVFPLVDAGLSREDCKTILVEAGLPVPHKSACVFCPYHDDGYWREMKARHPDEFARAVEFDRALRAETVTRFKGEVYLHASLQPLEDVAFTADATDHFQNECEGHCGL